MKRRNAPRYPRTARLNELVRQIVADELERIADERLELLAVTSVVVDPDMSHAVVYFDTLLAGDDDPEVLEALGELRIRLQRAIGRQARLKRTPMLEFRPDEVERRAGRIEGILREIEPVDPSTDDDDAAGA
jgi:ribosome-binding factor A